MMLTRSGKELKHDMTLADCGFVEGVMGYRVNAVYKQQDAESLITRTAPRRLKGLVMWRRHSAMSFKNLTKANSDDVLHVTNADA